MRRLLIAALAACVLVLPAHAQDHNFPTPGNATVPAVVDMCPNSSGNAVPWWANNGTWQCAAAVPTQGIAGGTATPTVGLGVATIGSGQVSVTSAGVTVVAARTGVSGTGRKTVCVTNITGTAPVYLGASGVTTSTGDYIPAAAGAGKCWDTQAAIYGIVSSTSQTVSYTETY